MKHGLLYVQASCAHIAHSMHLTHFSLDLLFEKGSQQKTQNVSVLSESSELFPEGTGSSLRFAGAFPFPRLLTSLFKFFDLIVFCSLKASCSSRSLFSGVSVRILVFPLLRLPFAILGPAFGSGLMVKGDVTDVTDGAVDGNMLSSFSTSGRLWGTPGRTWEL